MTPTNMHHFALDQLPATPWKNGGGTTREIVCQPPSAGMDSFDWRISIATIDQAGPFSAFPSMDRVIMLLNGAGVRLRADGIDHILDTAGQLFAFSGDAALTCDLISGTSTDFNVMSRRGRFRVDVQWVNAVRRIPVSAQGLLLAVRGDWQLKSEAHDGQCAAGHGLWWDVAARWQATPLETDAQLVWVGLHDVEMDNL
jgi:environmental stress-induced protein Ves